MEKTSNKFITFYKKFGIYVFLAAVVIIFSIIAPNFLSVANLINILRQVSIFGIVVIGVTMVMIGGGMDLSVGGIMAVVGMVMGYCMVNVGLPIPVAVIIGIALGVAFGAINGVVAIKLHIAPIIVTLAMIIAAMLAANPAKEYTSTVSLLTLIPASLAASLFPPSA